VTTACTHCGLPVPSGLLEPDAPRQFCCAGCRTAYHILHDVGLDRYYELSERRQHAVEPSGRSWEEFDHEAFHALYVRTRPDGLLETSLYLEGIHCASCVWLVERVPLAIPGVREAELNVGRSLARVVWDGAQLPLSAIARFLDTMGYRPHPFRGVKAEEVRRAEDRASLARIGVAAALAANVMTIAIAMYAGWFGGMEREVERYFRWLSLLLATPAILWPGRVFLQGAWAALRTRSLHMDVPIALALAAGFVAGAVNTVLDRGPVYFDGLTILIFLLLVGRFLQQRAQRAAIDASELLYALAPARARLVDGDAVRDVPTEALLPGMLLEVRAADTVPADGVVISGHSDVNVALLTGEPVPVPVTTGAQVFAGSVNVTAAFRMRVDQAGEESRIGRMLREVAEGARRRAPVVRTADRLAGWFVGAVLVLSAITWGLWIGRDADAALDHAISLLIVTCPCALALATPLAMTVAVGHAARAGILIKGGDAIESLARPGRLVLDKTGTVTEGRTALEAWTGPDDVRPLVLALERHSHHPVAEGLRSAWAGVAEAAVAEGVQHTLGGGLEGTVAGRRVVVGAPAFVLGRATDPAGMARAVDARWTPVVVAVDGTVVGVAGFGDPVRPDARAALDTLRQGGWQLELLSGDAAPVVERVGAGLGFAPGDVRGAATPEEKLRRIEALAAPRGTVVMVGDGVNDAAAMARASVGVGVHGGAEACLATADVFLSRPGLASLVDLMRGAGRTMRVIRRNIGISLVYNGVGVGLAMAGVLDPLVAAILMPISSATVILSSWRSRTFEERPS
jgi:Cu2+-exporting ATPase